MSKTSKPESDIDVLTIMEKYCQDKGYNFSDTQLDFMAQSCYLYFEGRGWKGISYWPAVAMRWVLNNLDKQTKANYKSKPQSKTVRQQILEDEHDK